MPYTIPLSTTLHAARTLFAFARRVAVLSVAATVLLGQRAYAQSTPTAAPISVPARGATTLAELSNGVGVKTRVLMIGAHPDDEDTQLITWLARGHRAVTAYLSLTRGDGGQNLIGNELGEALGVIRTEELLAARRIDGAHQYFTRAFDFGFSKTTTDTYAHWPHDSILGDAIKVIRAFHPQIIVSVFSGTPRDGHGQHQVSGLIAREAYDLAGDTIRFPTSVYGAAWTPLKFYRCARFVPERATMSMNVGEYNPTLGQSYAEIAADSRSQHKSQGFGTARRMGVVTDYVTREATRVNASTDAKAERSMFEGIDTTRAITDEDRNALALARSQIAVEAVAERERVAVGDSVRVRVSVFRNGAIDSSSSRTVYVHGTDITQPYWLAHPRTGDLFAFASDSIADDERAKLSWLRVPIALPDRSTPIDVRVPVIYRYADPVRGDVQRPLITAVPVSISFSREVELARANTHFDRPLEVTLRSSKAVPCTLTVSLSLPREMTTSTSTQQVILQPGATHVATFVTSGILPPGTFDITAQATDGRETYQTGFTPIEYDHITPERMYRSATIRVRSVDVSLPKNLMVGYVQGVGDNVAPALRELGVNVTIIEPTMLPVTDLSRFGTIIVGPRAYQASQTLIDNNAYLLQYARQGGNLVVQYGQYEMQRPGMMPYPITLGRPAVRVTEEDAPVRVLDSLSTFLRSPNRISAADFSGWIQERSVYMPTTFDSRYSTVLAMHDTGEPDNTAAILTTRYGKGSYTYVTLALFRQVPSGVAGGVRLFANLLAPPRP